MFDFFRSKREDYRARRDPLHPSNTPRVDRPHRVQRVSAESEPEKGSAFEEMLRRAKVYAGEQNIEALELLQRVALRQLQSYQISEGFRRPDDAAPDSLAGIRCFGLNEIPGKEGGFFSCLKRRELSDDKTIIASLARDMVLPTCWNPVSMTRLLGHLSPWKYDAMNHFVEYWSPLGIFWVKGGNHSIAHGILMGEGELPVTDAYDLDSLYPVVRFDGESWLDAENDQPIGRPRFPEFGIVFEIGRLILEVRQGAP